jgi:flagellar hook-length control protein FliK
MQVNLSANVSNPAGETNAKSAEVADAGAANGFFAQMGQILNQDNQNNKAQVDPAASVSASNSAEKTMRRLLQGTSLRMPQALTVEQAPVQNVSGALSQLFHGRDDETEAQDADPAQGIAEKSSGIALASGMESIPVSMSHAEIGLATLHPSFQVPVDSALTGGAPQPVIALDSADDAELHSPVRQAGSRISSLAGNRIAAGIADRGSLEEIPGNIRGFGINSEERAEYPTKPTGDAIQNFQMLDLQKENAPQPGWNIAPEAAGTVNDLMVSRNSMRQIEDPRAAFQPGLENAPQSVAGQRRAGNETDRRAVPQDQALSAQLNFDFIAAGTTASRRGMPGQPAGIAERQDRSLTDTLPQSENARVPIDDSPVTILRKSVITMPASPENSDTAAASAAQGQTLDKERPWMTMQGKRDHGQLPSGQPQLSAAERQPQMPSVFASSPAQFEELADSVSRRGMPGQPAGIAERQDRSLTDTLAQSENARVPIDDSPVAILRKSLKTMPASPENSDTAAASAAQGQTLDKERPWMTMQGKLEQGQLPSGRTQLSAAEHQAQTPSVFASSPTQYGELADSITAPPAQSSTSHEPELYFQLADQIRIQLRDGKREIRIQLKPDSLGRLEIRAENTIHGVMARISTESGAVKSYLENNLQLLQQTLQDQGLKIDRIHIVVQDGFDPQSSSGYTAQFGHAGSGQDGKESQPSSGKSSSSNVNSIEEAVLDTTSWLALNPNNRFYTVA